MIMIRCEQTGDKAYALDEEAAITAALTLIQDARDGGCRVTPTCSFYVDDKLVRFNLSRQDFSGAVL